MMVSFYQGFYSETEEPEARKKLMQVGVASVVVLLLYMESIESRGSRYCGHTANTTNLSVCPCLSMFVCLFVSLPLTIYFENLFPDSGCNNEMYFFTVRAGEPTCITGLWKFSDVSPWVLCGGRGRWNHGQGC